MFNWLVEWIKRELPRVPGCFLGLLAFYAFFPGLWEIHKLGLELILNTFFWWLL